MRVREARLDRRDESFLWRMLAETAAWRPGSALPSPESLRATAEYARYVRAWGRRDDFGLIAEAPNEAPVGAAWWRVFPEQDHGFGFVGTSVPELSIAVSREVRGQGIGTALLSGLLVRARDTGLAVSLSVERDNPALRLYERAGFVSCGSSGDALTMLYDPCGRDS